MHAEDGQDGDRTAVGRVHANDVQIVILARCAAGQVVVLGPAVAAHEVIRVECAVVAPPDARGLASGERLLGHRDEVFDEAARREVAPPAEPDLERRARRVVTPRRVRVARREDHLACE